MVVKVNNVLLDKLMNCAVVLRRYYFLFAKFKPKEKRRMGSEKLPRCHLKGYFSEHGLFCLNNLWNYRK